MINLGDKVKDKVSGLVGVATEKREYLNGCVQYVVQPKVDKEGKMPDAWSLDGQQLESMEKKVKIKKTRTGGPMRRA